jgi:hypothetical protein
MDPTSSFCCCNSFACAEGDDGLVGLFALLLVVEAPVRFAICFGLVITGGIVSFLGDAEGGEAIFAFDAAAAALV